MSLRIRNVSRETSRQGRISGQLAVVENLFRELDLTWDRETKDRWSLYISTFEAWSERTNLVSRADRPRWVERHVVPSLKLLRCLEIPSGSTIADVGTGAGFPGVPLALARPDCHFILIESKRWRVLFLEELREIVGLENVTVVGDRVESVVVQERWARRLDYALARAVADLETLWNWCEPLLKPGGAVVAFKGLNDVEAEAQTLTRKRPVEIRTLPIQPEKGSVLVVVRRREGDDAG